MSYIPRALAPTLHDALNGFPAVLVTGPRQAGKTTFVREELPDRPYVTFDDPLERDFARDDPRGFLARFDEGDVVLDEIQYVPELLSYLKMAIDTDRDRRGRWVLTGSQQFAVMQGVSESLAGRLAILDLYPLAQLEWPGEPDLEDLIFTGGYPELVAGPGKRDLWMRTYVTTYVERDVRQLANVTDLRAFEQLLALCAARHGQELNYSTLSRQVGVTSPTIKAWTGVLEASYLVTLLPPYHDNLGKRVIKSPKLYLVDPGLACWLTRQPDGAAALAGPMGGALFEGHVVTEALKILAARGRPADLWFWRSHDGLEVDLLLMSEGRLLPVEIKLTATPRGRHADTLSRFCALAGERAAAAGLLVCRVEAPARLPGGHLALPWRDWPAWLVDHVECRS